MLQMPLFGVVGYRRMLVDLAAAGYRMRPTEELGTSEQSVFMRHDVDCHLEGIISFARLEREMGCRSTWFVPVTFNFNVLHEPNSKVLRELVAFGHNIGLHYDPLVTRTREDLRRQVRVLENASGFKVRSVTSHKPGSIESRVDTSDWRVPIHSEYVSDSGRHWRDDRLMRLTHDQESFMLLTHVEHWMSAEQSLTDHFAASTLPNCTRQSQDHAVEVLTDCLSHDA
jgi:hypothetical protein